MLSLTRPLLGLTLLATVTATGCGEWRAAFEELLDGQGAAGTSGGSGTSAGGAPGTDAGAKVPPGTGSGGSTDNSTGTGGSTGGGTCIKIDGGGGPSSCKDAATWKKYGADACAQQKLVLNDIAYGPACGDNFQNATYVCCGDAIAGGTGSGGTSGGGVAACDAYTNATGAVCKRCVDATGVVVSDQCAPPQPPTSCMKLSDGGPSSCKDAPTWKQYGATTCAGLGLTLNDIAYGTPCGANFQDVVYVCCGPATPSCSLNTDALGNSCQTCWDAAGVVTQSVCKSSGVTCEESAGVDGATCKTCKYPDGRIYSAECSGGAPGGTEICDVRTNDDGTTCKVCYEPDGTTVSSCPAT